MVKNTNYLTRDTDAGECRWDKFGDNCPNTATKEAYNDDLGTSFKFCEGHIIEALYKLVLEEITVRVLSGGKSWLTPQD